MTERFIIVENDKNYLRVDDKTKEKFYLNEREIVECLNNLHEENIALKRTDNICDLETQIMQLREELDYYKSKCGSLEEGYLKLQRENEQLKQFISKIDFAIIRKYDNSLENLLDEIYDGEYENWIKKQVSRAKKLDGDV